MTLAVNLRRICQQHPSATSSPLPNNDASPFSQRVRATAHGLIAKPVGGRPSRNRKRPTDHAGAYPRARAFPAVPPSPPLVMQRHRILSRDGEAARRILVPQIDFTLHSPSGRYESFPDSALSHPIREHPSEKLTGEVGLSQGRKICSDAGNPRFRAGRSKAAFEFPKWARETRVRGPWSVLFPGARGRRQP